MKTIACQFNLEASLRSEVQVGEGRGFVMRTARGPVVVTAAHCLPSLPPPFAAARIEERTFRGLVGYLGEEPSLWAECVFVDPVADIAILGAPDDQALPKESERFQHMLFASEKLRLGDSNGGRSWLLSLDRQWNVCSVEEMGARGYLISEAQCGVVGGMSGSPILSTDGAVIGVVATAAGDDGGGPNPRLSMHLPAWASQQGAPHAS